MKASISLLTVICGLTKALIREHFYLNISRNWTDAQSYCRTYYEDLSTITNQEEQDMLIQLSGGNQNVKWIGLYRHIEPNSNWLWSDGNSVTFTTWDIGQPNNANRNQYCVATSNRWNDLNCNNFYPFFCFKTKLILVKEKKTWEEAEQYCRTHHTDLASITSEKQLQLAKNKTRESQTEIVWTGLRYLAGEWFWVSNEPLGSQTSLPECPTQPCRCGARNTKTDKWENRDCDEKLNFLCS